MNTGERSPGSGRRGQPRSGRPAGRLPRGLAFWFLVLIALVMFLVTVGNQKFLVQQEPLHEPELLEMIRENRVESLVFIQGGEGPSEVRAKMRAEGARPERTGRFLTNDQGVEQLKELAQEHKVTFEFRTPSRLSEILLWWLVPLILFVAVFYFLFMRQMRAAGGGNVFTFGKSRARRIGKERPKVTFNDVAGIDEDRKSVV